MAAIWKGSLAFGLVNIPVELRTAIRADHISFRLLHKEDLSPVKYERVCQADGEPVPWNEIVKGYEYSKGKFVVLTEDDFKSTALEKSKSIDILDFVQQEEIDPRYFETPYYLVPSKGAEKSYALLREAIGSSASVLPFLLEEDFFRETDWYRYEQITRSKANLRAEACDSR